MWQMYHKRDSKFFSAQAIQETAIHRILNKIIESKYETTIEDDAANTGKDKLFSLVPF
jgi:hypothetical protein